MCCALEVLRYVHAVTPQAISTLAYQHINTLKTLSYSKLMLKPKPLNSCSNTFSDSGIPGAGIGSPFTIAS